MLGFRLQLSTRHLTIGAASRPHRLHARLPTEKAEVYDGDIHCAFGDPEAWTGRVGPVQLG